MTYFTLLLRVTFSLFILSCKNENGNGEDKVSLKDSAQKIRDPRLEGIWFVYGFNDPFKITMEEMSISDGKGNDYPSGSYHLENVDSSGGSGKIVINEKEEVFSYEIIGGVVSFDFLRIGRMRCSRERW